jgi:hypothetical protein
MHFNRTAGLEGKSQQQQQQEEQRAAGGCGTVCYSLGCGFNNRCRHNRRVKMTCPAPAAAVALMVLQCFSSSSWPVLPMLLLAAAARLLPAAGFADTAMTKVHLFVWSGRQRQ